MSDYDRMFKSIVDRAFGDEHDQIEAELSGFNLLLDRIDAWKKSPVEDDRDFAGWLQRQLIKNIVARL